MKNIDIQTDKIYTTTFSNNNNNNNSTDANDDDKEENSSSTVVVVAAANFKSITDDPNVDEIQGFAASGRTLPLSKNLGIYI